MCSHVPTKLYLGKQAAGWRQPASPNLPILHLEDQLSPPNSLQCHDFLLRSCLFLICCAQSLSHVRLFATPWTVAGQAPLSLGFSKQEYLSGQPLPSQGILPTQRLNLGLPQYGQILYHLSHQGSPGIQRKGPQNNLLGQQSVIWLVRCPCWEVSSVRTIFTPGYMALSHLQTLLVSSSAEIICKEVEGAHFSASLCLLLNLIRYYSQCHTESESTLILITSQVI